MYSKIDVINLTKFVVKNYGSLEINNTDFIIDLHIRLKKELHIKSVIKQGIIKEKATVYLQIKNIVDILHVYYDDENNKINIVSKKNSDIK